MLIVSEWQSAPFWPLLYPSKEEFAYFVQDRLELPLSEFLILPGLSGFTLFHGKMPNTRVLALRCDLEQEAQCPWR